MAIVEEHSSTAVDEKPPNELLRAVLCNDEEGVLNLIEENVDVNDVDGRGITALHIAAFFGRESIVRALLEAGARLDARDQFWVTPLHRACWRDHSSVLEILLTNGGNACATCRRFMTALHVCAQQNAVRCASLLIRDSPLIIDKTDWSGCTALDHAAYLGNLEMIELLLGFKANHSARNKKGRSAVHWAALGGHFKVLRVLLEHGAEINSADSEGNTVLHYAAVSGNADTLAFVLQNSSIAVDCVNTAGFSALHFAVNSGCPVVVKTLFDAGADLSVASTADAITALHLAVGYCEGTGCCEYLLKVCTDLEQRAADGSTALHFACEYGRITRTKLLVTMGASVNARTRAGVTPLHIASRFGHDIIVKHLLIDGADPSIQTLCGETALHLAAYRGFLRVVRLLCDYGADVNATDSNGRTSLHVAAQSNNSNSEPMVEYLIAMGASVSAVDSGGRSALHYAALNACSPTVYKIMSAGAEANLKDNGGLTPLHYCAPSLSEFAFKCAKHLCRGKSRCVQERDNNGFLPIHYAITAGNADVVFLMADVMSDVWVPSSKYPYHLTLYHVAARYKHSQLLLRLLSFYQKRSLQVGKQSSQKLKSCIGIEPDACGWIPMHYAMQQGCQQSVEILLGTAIRKKALVWKGRDGTTPLHLAALFGKSNCLALALELLKPEDVNVVDMNGRSSLMFAITAESAICVDVLLSKGDVSLKDRWGRGMVHRACATASAALCARLVQRDADFVAPDCHGVTPLHLAARADDVLSVELLLSKGAKEEKDLLGLYPFDWAAAEGNVNMLKCLLSEGSPASRFNAILLAASHGHTDACQLLLDERPAYVESLDVCGRTPLHLAASCGSVALVRLLIDRGASLTATDHHYSTPIMAAVSCKVHSLALLVVDLLLKEGASMNDRDVDGNSMFHLACLAHNEELASYLLKKVEPLEDDNAAEHIVNFQNNKKQTALHLACRAGMANFLPELVCFSPYSLMLTDENGRTALLAPIDNEDVADCMTFLLEVIMDAPAGGHTRTSIASSSRHSRKTSSIGTTETEGDTF